MENLEFEDPLRTQSSTRAVSTSFSGHLFMTMTRARLLALVEISPNEGALTRTQTGELKLPLHPNLDFSPTHLKTLPTSVKFEFLYLGLKSS